MCYGYLLVSYDMFHMCDLIKIYCITCFSLLYLISVILSNKYYSKTYTGLYDFIYVTLNSKL